MLAIKSIYSIHELPVLLCPYKSVILISGTHGHMKCVFDGQLKSQDTILMNLYKRVFPKWTYEPYVNSPPSYYDNSTFRPQEEPML